MIPLHDLQGPGKNAPLVRALRLAARIARRPERVAALSLAIWLLCVAGFAFWTLHHYHVASGVPWIGMTVRTSAVAIWLLVAREWLLIQLLRRYNQTAGEKRRH